MITQKDWIKILDTLQSYKRLDEELKSAIQKEIKLSMIFMNYDIMTDLIYYYLVRADKL